MAERGQQRKLVGTVMGNQANKTVLVMVERLTKHATYGKYVRKRSKFMAHDPQNSCGIGDKVRIVESRPISKRKRWAVADIIEKGNIAE